MSHPTPNLIELRHHYESVIAQSKHQLAQASAQLEYIDALLVNGLLQGVTPTLKEGIEPDLLEYRHHPEASSRNDWFTSD
jgi:hypothetical protein